MIIPPSKTKRASYSQQVRQKAVNFVRSGQSIAGAADMLGIPRKTLSNWVKAEISGSLHNETGQAVESKQKEITRLHAELTQITQERDLLI